MGKAVCVLVLSGVLTIPASASADIPKDGTDIGKVTYTLPAPYPTAAEVLRALPAGARNNIRIVCKIIVHRVERPRFYPLVGTARLVESRFKCTVYSDRGAEVVYVDRDRLEPVK